MSNISNNGIINLHRGDSFYAPIFINLGDALDPIRYYLIEGDKLCVGIAEPNQKFDDSIIRKVCTYKDTLVTGDVMFTLAPEDTEELKPGNYYIEAKLLMNNGRVATIIPRRKFIVYE